MPRKTRRKSATYGWTSAVTLLLLLGVTLWVGRSLRLAEVPSRSMVPTLKPGDVLSMRIDAYRTRMPQRGEIIIFRDLQDGGYIVKRVIGEAGEEVTVWSGRVWINRRRLAESYVSGKLILERPERVTLQDDEVWVMGDNRNFSDDSRDFGPVKKSQIVGRAAAILWPPGRRGPLVRPDEAPAAAR
jgi:signal peptidase I